METTIPKPRGGRRTAARAARRAAFVLCAAVPTPALGAEIVVSAAASLREPLTRLERGFEATHADRVAISFGASSWLAAQIRAGAPVDVFLSADEQQVTSLARDGLVSAGSRAVFARNALTLVVAPGARFDVVRPADLAQPGLRRFALPAAAVPLGRYARLWLARHDLMDALGDRVVQTADARATLAAVDLGQADAALVYATDARLARRARRVFTPAPDEQPAILYVGVLTTRGVGHSAALSFLAYLLGPGRAELEAAGFMPPGRR